MDLYYQSWNGRGSGWESRQGDGNETFADWPAERECTAACDRKAAVICCQPLTEGTASVKFEAPHSAAVHASLPPWSTPGHRLPNWAALCYSRSLDAERPSHGQGLVYRQMPLTLMDISPEIIFSLIVYLSPRDIISCQRACRTLCNVPRDTALRYLSRWSASV